MPDYICIATWPFGQTAVKVASELLQQGRPALDAAIAGAQAVEDDPKVNSVGYGGIANAIGTVQLDACVMDGKTLGCGAVAVLGSLALVSGRAAGQEQAPPHDAVAEAQTPRDVPVERPEQKKTAVMVGRRADRSWFEATGRVWIIKSTPEFHSGVRTDHHNLEPLAAHPIRRLPQRRQRVLDCRTISTLALLRCPDLARPNRRASPECAHRMLAMPARRRAQRV